MARKASLFTGGSKSVSARLNIADRSSPSLRPKLNNSLAAIQQRETARKTLPTPSLDVSVNVLDRGKAGVFRRNFTPLAEKYPQHRELIEELLVGARLTVKAKRASTNARNTYNAISEFTNFLNSNRNLSNTVVMHMSDITLTVCKSFSNYLVATYPRRSINRKLYGALRRAVYRLKDHYSADERIGPPFHWPPGPGKYEFPRQGYSPKALNELVTVCRREISDVMTLHRSFSGNHHSTELILGEEWTLENLMFHLNEGTKNRYKFSEETTIKRALYSSRQARAFLQREGYRTEDIVALYKSQGDELSKTGTFPVHARLGETLIRKRIVPTPDGTKGNDWSLGNLMFWLKHKPRRLVSISEKIGKYLGASKGARKFMHDNGYTKKEIVAIFNTRGAELAKSGRTPYGTSIVHRPDAAQRARYFDRAVRTVATRFPEYPYYMSFSEAQYFLSYRRYLEMSTSDKDSVMGRILRVMFESRPTFWNGALGAQNTVYATRHFLVDTLYPFLLLAQINSGWNLESILAISDNVDDHVVDDLIDPENYVVLQSTKKRTGSSGRDKPVFHRSNRKNKFGMYRLLKYVESVVSQYKDSPHYLSGHLWQFTSSATSSVRSLISSFRLKPNFHGVTRRFIARHTWRSYSEVGVDHGRIRTSYETIRELQGLTEFEISDDMDHADVDTTAVHYASDGSSNTVKDIKIAAIQSKLLDDLRHYDCRLVESKTLAELREAILEAHSEAERKKHIDLVARESQLSEKSILHLLSPEGQTYIVACSDAKHPTWKGHEHFVGGGKKCRYFNKCAQCKRAVIFREALPYVARRILDLEKIRSELNQFEWLANFGDEHEAWQQILEHWSDEQQVSEAWAVARRGGIVLPISMRGG